MCNAHYSIARGTDFLKVFFTALSRLIGFIGQIYINVTKY